MKLYYFDLGGRAEVIRMMLHYAKVEFEDVRVQFGGLQELKDKGICEFGQLPVFEMDGKHYSQTMAIVFLLAKKYGFYPADAEKAWEVESMMSFVGDLAEKIAPVTFIKDEEAKKKKIEENMAYSEKWFGFLEARLKKNCTQKFVATDKITCADFLFLSMYACFFNNDLKDRAIFLVAALTGSIGRPGGNVGSYAGNYRTSLFSGVPRYVAEDPFNAQLAADGPVTTRSYYRGESLHYYAAGEVVHREGTKQFTTGPHVPTPTKAIWLSNSNSQIANTKYHYNVVFNTLPRQECVVVNEWWWSGSCEYADIVYGVDSWMEFKYPDITASNTNPFLQVWKGGIKPLHDSRDDIEILAGIGKKLAEVTGDQRFAK